MIFQHFSRHDLVKKNYAPNILIAVGLQLYEQSLFCSRAVLEPCCITSLQEEWIKVDPAPEGIIDRLVS